MFLNLLTSSTKSSSSSSKSSSTAMKPTAQKRKSMPAGSHAFRIHDLLKKRKEDLAVKDGNIAASIAAASASAVAAALVAPSSSSSSSSSFQAVEVIEDDSEKALPRAIRQVAATQ